MVAAAANRDLQVARPGEPDRLDDVLLVLDDGDDVRRARGVSLVPMAAEGDRREVVVGPRYDSALQARCQRGEIGDGPGQGFTLTLL